MQVIPQTTYRHLTHGITISYTHMSKLKIIDKYILRKFLATFALAISLIIVIIIVFDVSEKLDDFLENHAPLHLIVVQYYLNFIPSFINLFSPLFVFIAVVYFTSKMAGHTEIIAILGNGITFRQFIKPYIIGSSIIAFVILILGNFVIPINNTYVTDFDVAVRVVQWEIPHAADIVDAII